MKRLVIFLLTLTFVFTTFSQTAINADGSLKYKGNVAILVKGRNFTFRNGIFTPQVDDPMMQTLKTALRLYIMERIQNYGFAIVNRDNEAFNQVTQLIQENKLEDYIDGISIQAKNQGADYLLIMEIINYGENDAAAQIQIATRLIDVENNLGYHTFYRSAPLELTTEKDIVREVQTVIQDFSKSIENLLFNIFPEQYFIAKADGKDLYLGAYQMNGGILKTDILYAFKFEKTSMNYNSSEVPINVLEKVAECSIEGGKDGYLHVKANNSIENTSNVVLFRNNPQPLFRGTNQISMTFFGLDYDFNSYDGLIKNRINNAIYNAISLHPGLQLIEHDHLPELKKERELQKGEDFINGHTVEQMKAIGASTLLTLESYNRQGTEVSFKVSTISVAKNQIIKTVDVKSSIDNIENEMYKVICDRAAYPCTIKFVDKDKIEMNSVISLRDGNDCILELKKEIRNPLTNEVTFSLIDLCHLTFTEYMGNRSIMSIDKILSKEDMENLEEKSEQGLLSYRLDGSNIESYLTEESGVQTTAKKVEKKTKRKKIWQKIKETAKDISNDVIQSIQDAETKTESTPTKTVIKKRIVIN